MKTIEVIECGQTMTIEGVSSLYPKLLTMLLQEKQVVFDCSQIEHVDTAALQMLYAFSKASSHYGCTINWQGASDAFIQRALLLGVANAMGLSTQNRNGIEP